MGFLPAFAYLQLDAVKNLAVCKADIYQ